MSYCVKKGIVLVQNRSNEKWKKENYHKKNVTSTSIHIITVVNVLIVELVNRRNEN
jgi:hypothetical protein